MQRGDGALAFASWNGNVEIAEKLIELGLDVNEAHFVRNLLMMISRSV